MKTLIVYYSRTGTTKKVAEALAKKINCDSEEILDIKSRAGPLGYIMSGKEATLKTIPEIKKTKKDPAKYDLVIIGTPVWAFTVASPLRTYLVGNDGKFKKVAFFCTMGGSGDKKTFSDMAILCKKEPVALLSLKTKEVIANEHYKNVDDFIKKLKK